MRRLAFISPLALAACTSAAPSAEDLIPNYLGIETTALDNDLVQFNVAMSNAVTEAALRDYADCAAAKYTLVQGFSFARHLRTNVYKEGGVWAADAVYTISPDLPEGLAKIDAEVVAAACAESGIPMV